MIQFDAQAQRRLNEYVQELRRTLRRSGGADAAEVEADVRHHIEMELQAADKPVTVDALNTVLRQLGGPDQWDLGPQASQSRRRLRQPATLNPLERIEVASNRTRRALLVAGTALVASVFVFALVQHVANSAYPPTNVPDTARGYLDRVGRMFQHLTAYPATVALCPLLPVLICLMAAFQYTDIDRRLPLRRFRIRPILSIVGVPLLVLAAIVAVSALIGRWDQPSYAKRVVRTVVGVVGWGAIYLVPWLAYAYAFRLLMALSSQKLASRGKRTAGRAAAWAVYAVGILLVAPLAHLQARRIGNGDGDGQSFVMCTAGLGLLVLLAVGLADLLQRDVGRLALDRPAPSTSNSRRFHSRPAE